jgi:hypothetical protein
VLESANDPLPNPGKILQIEKVKLLVAVALLVTVPSASVVVPKLMFAVIPAGISARPRFLAAGSSPGHTTTVRTASRAAPVRRFLVIHALPNSAIPNMRMTSIGTTMANSSRLCPFLLRTIDLWSIGVISFTLFPAK